MSSGSVRNDGAARRRNPLVHFLSRIWFGVLLLTLILIYSSVFSALPQVRGAIETTEMRIFQHWLFVTLVALFCTALTVATWVRIRWNLMNLGVLTTHTGLLMLTGGAVWYFGNKVEGDVLLRSPRIELWSNGAPIRASAILAEKDQHWHGNMPALGGAVSVHVLETQPDGMQPVGSARVEVALGNGPPKTVELTRDAPEQPVSERLAVRLTVFPLEDTFYENEKAALYYREIGSREQKVVALDGLPLHRERYTDEGYQLRDSADRPMPSKRVWPHVKLGGLTIPTGWFEEWSLPRPEIPELPFDIEVTGYVPYIARMDARAAGGGDKLNPAINLELSSGRQSVQEALFALDPVRSLLATNVPFEFRWVETAEQRDALIASLAGPHELSVEVIDPPLSRTLAVSEGQVIELEGTPYTLTIKQLAPSWPMMTPGFEGASSPMASVDVKSADKSYNRTVIQRFPQLSQDIDEQGVRHREGPYDPNLVLRYRTAATGWVTIVAGPGIEPVVAVFETDGRATVQPLPPGQPAMLRVRGTPIAAKIRDLHEHGRMAAIPVLEPLEVRRPNLAPRALSAIRLKFTGRGERADWSESQWIRFSQYPHIDQIPLTVKVPWDERAWELIYSRYPRPLGGQLAGRKLSVEFFPGRQSVESWRSDFVQRVDGGEPQAGAVYTNQTHPVGRWTLFQSGAAQDHWSYTVLGVGNRHGIWPMTLACILIPLGCMYAFYIKPILRRRRMTGTSAGGGVVAAGSRPGRAEAATVSPELAEVGR